MALLIALGFSGCGSCEGENPIEAQKARLWGRTRVAAEVEQQAKQNLDPATLDERPNVKTRVLTMSWDEVVARMGFVIYEGKATFRVERNGRALEVVENTLIEHGRDGSYRVLQKGKDGKVTRETVFVNDIFFVRNGPGKLRVQGIIEDQDVATREEAWEPLKSFTQYYGVRIGLAEAGTDDVEGRTAIRYDFVLMDGSAYVTVPGIKGRKKPLSLRGQLWVDAQTAVPTKANFTGRLEIPPPKPDQAPGRLDVSLSYTIKPGTGEEIKPGEYIPTIAGRPVDLDPLRFLKEDTRTSTVIGGKKKSKSKKP